MANSSEYQQLAIKALEDTKVEPEPIRVQFGYGSEAYYHITRIANSLGIPHKRVIEAAVKTMSLALLGVNNDEPTNQ